MTRIGTHLLTPKKMTRETTENLVNSRFYIRPPITDLVLLESQLSGEEKNLKGKGKINETPGFYFYFFSCSAYSLKLVRWME